MYTRGFEPQWPPPSPPAATTVMMYCPQKRKDDPWDLAYVKVASARADKSDPILCRHRGEFSASGPRCALLR